ncbi:MAG TPA: nucleotidyltransferase domain-containing protein [Longimicrobium sp.]|nr:nucleotidyltransferase domain-containing protein [Longimicrobium sp.]
MLASRALAYLILYFLVHPDAAPHFRALQRATGLASRSLQHELARLQQLGMLQSERDGRLMRYRRVADYPRWSPFRELVRQFADPGPVLRIALADVPGLEAAFIYGSCARGEMHPESDIDVFALGDTLKDVDTRLALTQRTVEASVLLDREVSVTRYTRNKLEARRTGGFLSSVLAGPKQWLVGDETVLHYGGALG